jgi:hypothetical protein
LAGKLGTTSDALTKQINDLAAQQNTTKADILNQLSTQTAQAVAKAQADAAAQLEAQKQADTKAQQDALAKAQADAAAQLEAQKQTQAQAAAEAASKQAELTAQLQAQQQAAESAAKAQADAEARVQEALKAQQDATTKAQADKAAADKAQADAEAKYQAQLQEQAAKAQQDAALQLEALKQAQAQVEEFKKAEAQRQAEAQAAAQAEAQRQAEAQKADITAKHQQSAQAGILNASGLGLSNAQANALAVKFINANDLNTNSSLNWSDPSSIQSFVNDWLYGTPSADASNNKGPQYTVDVEPLLDANTWETIPRLTSQQLQDRYNSFTAAQQADINKYYMDTYGKNLNDYAKSLPANVIVDAKLPPITALNIDTGLTPRQNAELMSNGVNSAGFGSLLENAFKDGVLTKPDSFSDYKTLSNQISSFLDPNYKPQYAQDSDFVNGLRVAVEKGAAPLGLGTYVEAAVRTLGNDKSYSQNLDAINNEIYNWTRDNPWASGLSESLGSVLGTAMGGSPLGLLSTAYNMFTNPAFTDVDPVALNEVRKFTPSDYMMPDFLSSQTNKLGPPAISQNAAGEKTGYWDNPYTSGNEIIPVPGGDVDNFNAYVFSGMNVTGSEYNPAFDYAEYNKTGQTQYSQSYLDSLLTYGTDPNATTPAGAQNIDAIDWATANPSDYEYSYDGGKTWTTQVPAGISAISNTIGAGSSDPFSGSSWDFGGITDSLSNWFDASNSWVDWSNNWFSDFGGDWWDVPLWGGKEGGTIPNPDDEYLNPQSPYKVK